MSKPAPKEKTPKQKLAEGAAALRKAQAAEKKASKPAKPAVKPKALKPKKVDTAGNLDVLPPIEASTKTPEQVMKKYVNIAPDHGSLTVDEKISIGDYVLAFDEINGLRESSQFLLGDLINQGESLPCFGGKYAVAMASTGRPISTLKGYAHVARQIPADLRSLSPALTYSHCKEVAFIPRLEDKREVLTAAAESASNGQVPTVKEMRAKAAKFKKKPKKTPTAKPDKHTAKPDLNLSSAERDVFNDLEDTAAKLDREIEGASFVLEMSSKQTATLREKLDRIARFFQQIS